MNADVLNVVLPFGTSFLQYGETRPASSRNAFSFSWVVSEWRRPINAVIRRRTAFMLWPYDLWPLLQRLTGLLGVVSKQISEYR